jgi:hypothetical protein
MIFAVAMHAQSLGRLLIRRLTPLSWLPHWPSAHSWAATIDLLHHRQTERNRIMMNRQGETVLVLAGPDPSRATAQEQQQRAFHALLLLRLIEDTGDAGGRPLGASERRLLRVNGRVETHDGLSLIHPVLLRCVVARLAELKVEVDRLRLELRSRGVEQQIGGDYPPAYDERASR